MTTVMPLDAALRTWELRWIKSKFLAGAQDNARIDGLTGPAQRDPCHAAFPMHGYLDRTLVCFGVLTAVDAASLLNQPFSKCCAFQSRPPMS